MTQVWQFIAYLDPDTGQPFCGWCQKFGHGIENCPQLEPPKQTAIRIVEDLPSFSVETEREHRSFTIAWKTFWLSCGAAILAVIWRLTR